MNIRQHLPRGTQARIARELRITPGAVTRALADQRPEFGTRVKKLAAKYARPRRAFAAWFPGEVTP